MQALRALEGVKTATVMEVDVPKVEHGDVLIKVKAAGLAPGMFSLLEMGMLRNLPMTLGHEASGVVEEIGEGVEGISVGDRVRVYPNMSCGKCKYCGSDREQMCAQAGMIGFMAPGEKQTTSYLAHRDGALAEFIRVPWQNVDLLPDNVSFEVGAKMHDLANAVRALKSAELPAGSTLIILAATGTMGTATIRLAKHFGVARLVLVGRSSARLEALRVLSDLPMEVVALDLLGEDWVEKKALASCVAQITHGQADAVIDYGGQGTDMWQALAGLGTNGSLVHMGGNLSVLPVPMIGIMSNCWRIIGTRNHTRSDSDTVLRLLASGDLEADDLISHRFPFSQIEKAIQAFRTRSLPIWMGVIQPD